ncbi:MAG: SDR family oxidoreductase [Verrucomicrobia bacterium]|nr:SDR family oxidoreductase [Verrucomicrobiota bacterium]
MSGRLANRVVALVPSDPEEGLETAAALVREGAIAALLAHDERGADQARERLGERGVALAASDRRPEAAAGLVRVAVGNFGRLDALCHITRPPSKTLSRTEFHKTPAEAWDKELRAAVDPVFFSHAAAISHWLEQKTAGLVVDALRAEPEPQNEAPFAGALIQEAIAGLVQGLAARYGSRGIRLNLLRAPLVPERSGTKSPLPGQIVDALAFFFSRAGSFVSGATLPLSAKPSSAPSSSASSPGAAKPQAPEAAKPAAASGPPMGAGFWRALGRAWGKSRPKTKENP